MRILTRTQYDAICDIVTEKDKKIAELEAKVSKQEEIIDYLNKKVFAANDRLLSYMRKNNLITIDFPATTKQPENKLFY